MPTKRKFTATFPTAKIKKIMQLDEDIGKISATVPSVVSCGVESLVKQLVTESYELAVNRNSRTVTASHLKKVIENHPEFQFLCLLISEIPNLKPISISSTGHQHVSIDSMANGYSTGQNSLNEHASENNQTPVDVSIGIVKKPRGRPRKTQIDQENSLSQTQTKKRRMMTMLKAEKMENNPKCEYNDAEDVNGDDERFISPTDQETSILPLKSQRKMTTNVEKHRKCEYDEREEEEVVNDNYVVDTSPSIDVALNLSKNPNNIISQ